MKKSNEFNFTPDTERINTDMEKAFSGTENFSKVKNSIQIPGMTKRIRRNTIIAWGTVAVSVCLIVAILLPVFGKIKDPYIPSADTTEQPLETPEQGGSSIVSYTQNGEHQVTFYEFNGEINERDLLNLDFIPEDNPRATKWKINIDLEINETVTASISTANQYDDRFLFESYFEQYDTVPFPGGEIILENGKGEYEFTFPTESRGSYCETYVIYVSYTTSDGFSHTISYFWREAEKHIIDTVHPEVSITTVFDDTGTENEVSFTCGQNRTIEVHSYSKRNDVGDRFKVKYKTDEEGSVDVDLYVSFLYKEIDKTGLLTEKDHSESKELVLINGEIEFELENPAKEGLWLYSLRISNKYYRWIGDANHSADDIIDIQIPVDDTAREVTAWTEKGEVKVNADYLSTKKHYNSIIEGPCTLKENPRANHWKIRVKPRYEEIDNVYAFAFVFYNEEDMHSVPDSNPGPYMVCDAAAVNENGEIVHEFDLTSEIDDLESFIIFAGISYTYIYDANGEEREKNEYQGYIWKEVGKVPPRKDCSFPEEIGANIVSYKDNVRHEVELAEAPLAEDPAFELKLPENPSSDINKISLNYHENDININTYIKIFAIPVYGTDDTVNYSDLENAVIVMDRQTPSFPKGTYFFEFSPPKEFSEAEGVVYWLRAETQKYHTAEKRIENYMWMEKQVVSE